MVPKQSTEENQADWVDATLDGQPPLLTIPEAARLLRMSERQIYRMGRSGRLALVSKGGEESRRVVPKVSIAKYLRALEVTP
jgi:hypothetical protein